MLVDNIIVLEYGWFWLWKLEQRHLECRNLLRYSRDKNNNRSKKQQKEVLTIVIHPHTYIFVKISKKSWPVNSTYNRNTSRIVISIPKSWLVGAWWDDHETKNVPSILRTILQPVFPPTLSLLTHISQQNHYSIITHTDTIVNGLRFDVKGVLG